MDGSEKTPTAHGTVKGKEDLLALLCKSHWTYDVGIFLKFDEDYTGTIMLGYFPMHCILCMFKWKVIPDDLVQRGTPPKHEGLAEKSRDAFTSAPHGVKDEPRNLGHLELEITYTDQPPKDLQESQRACSKVTQTSLKDEAFLPKRFIVSFDEGVFIDGETIERHMSSDPDVAKHAHTASRYSYRAVFNRSPYPPLHEWKWTDHVHHRHMQITEFVSHHYSVSDSQRKIRAMNHPRGLAGDWWCVVS